MPDNESYTPIQKAWKNYTISVRLLVGPQPDDRPLDQYLEFRDTVFSLVQSKEFLNELEKGFNSETHRVHDETRKALIMELEAFPKAIEIAQTTEKTEEKQQGWWRNRWSGRAATVAGSVEDLIEDLPPWAKQAITLFKEAIDLFKGKD